MAQESAYTKPSLSRGKLTNKQNRMKNEEGQQATAIGSETGLRQRHELALVRSERVLDICTAKGGMMKEPRGKVLKRLSRSSFYCDGGSSGGKNRMKTEQHLEPTAVFIQRVTAAVSELKDHLQQDYERTYPGLGEIIRIVLDEEEAKAWELSFFSHLFLPDMVEAHIANLSLSRERCLGATITGLDSIAAIAEENNSAVRQNRA
jgi:hypothetical protein